MDVCKVALCFVLIVLCYVSGKSPTIKIQAFKPRGLRVTASWDKNLTFFAFEGRYQVGRETKGYALPSQTNKWVYYDPTATLRVNDVITYRILVSSDEGLFGSTESRKITGISTDEMTFKVTELEVNPDAAQWCEPSVTRLPTGTACKGHVIFRDDFDTLDTDVWRIEHYIPMDHPEAPFVSYQRSLSNPTVYVKDGMLYIQPRLQQDLPGFSTDSIISGTLDLSSRCTRPSCVYQAVGDVIPPVASGRLASGSFAFTYGNLTVRAKLPQGDWLYPEILLEPLANTYGSMNYASGILKIASALGNREVDNPRYSNKFLQMNLILNGKCRKALQSSIREPMEGFWGDVFHEYTVSWTPGGIEFYVDGVRHVRNVPDYRGLRSWLPQSCLQDQDDWQSTLELGGLMAPFNEHFFITLGVAAGGVTEFPDGLRSRGALKPWRNSDRKARVKFWEAWPDWHPTWNNSALIIDYIKVVAL